MEALICRLYGYVNSLTGCGIILRELNLVLVILYSALIIRREVKFGNSKAIVYTLHFFSAVIVVERLVRAENIVLTKYNSVAVTLVEACAVCNA